jgi:hypothetical protein
VVLDALPAWQQAAWRAKPLNLALFQRLLASDFDQEFLLGVVENGVLLVPDVEQLQPFVLPNYSSAVDAAAQVQRVLSEEVRQVWVLPAPDPPRFVHPLGVVPKSTGGIRVIHDHSAPVGSSVNDQQVYVRHSWDTLELAMPFFVPHVFMALILFACSIALSIRQCLTDTLWWDPMSGFQTTVPASAFAEWIPRHGTPYSFLTNILCPELSCRPRCCCFYGQQQQLDTGRSSKWHQERRNQCRQDLSSKTRGLRLRKVRSAPAGQMLICLQAGKLLFCLCT